MLVVLVQCVESMSSYLAVMLSGTRPGFGRVESKHPYGTKEYGAIGALRLALLAQGDILKLFNEFLGQHARRVPHESCGVRIGVEDELRVIVGDGAVNRVIGLDGGNQKHSQAEKD